MESLTIFVVSIDLSSLLEHGKYNEVISHLKEVDDPELLLFKLKALNGKEEISQALDLSNEILNYTIDQELKIKTLTEKCILFNKQGKEKEAIQLIHLVEQEIQSKELNLKSELSKLHELKGMIYFKNGQLIKAKSAQKIRLSLSQEIGTSIEIAQDYNNLGNTYRMIGKLDESLNHYLKSLSIGKESNNRMQMAMSLANIGNIYSEKGEIDLSLNYHLKALKIRQETKEEPYIANSYSNLGQLLFLKGEVDESIKYLELGLKLRQQYGSTTNIHLSIHQLIHVYLSLNKQEEAELLLKELEIIAQREKNALIHVYYKYNKAIFLKKTARRSKQKVMAQNLFQEIIETQFLENNTIKVESMLHLCELYLAEYKILGSNEIFIDIKTLIAEIYEIAQEKKSYALIIQTYILNSKIYLLENNLKMSENFLEMAELVAMENSISGLVEKVRLEKEKLFNDANKWRKILDSNISAIEKIKEIEFDDYLTKIIQMNNRLS